MPDLLELLLTSIWDVRIGVPLGIYLGIPIWEALMIGTAVATAAIAPSLFLLSKFLRWAKTGYPSLFNWLFRFTSRYHRQIERYGYFGLMMLVGIPLPGTGPWVGVVVAALLALSFLPAFLAITLGVVISATITAVITVQAL